MSRRNIAEPLALGMVLGLAAALRWPFLQTGIWRDEGSTYFDVVAGSLRATLHEVAHSELSPPGYFVLLRGWTALDRDVGIRAQASLLYAGDWRRCDDVVSGSPASLTGGWIDRGRVRGGNDHRDDALGRCAALHARSAGECSCCHTGAERLPKPDEPLGRGGVRTERSSASLGPVHRAHHRDRDVRNGCSRRRVAGASSRRSHVGRGITRRTSLLFAAARRVRSSGEDGHAVATAATAKCLARTRTRASCFYLSNRRRPGDAGARSAWSVSRCRQLAPTASASSALRAADRARSARGSTGDARRSERTTIHVCVHAAGRRRSWRRLCRAGAVDLRSPASAELGTRRERTVASRFARRGQSDR